MFAFYRNCLFCNVALPDVRSGEGEHVIPRSILGFWRIHDVCHDCISFFGQSVDRLAVQNTEILDAMKHLGIGNVDSLLENVSWKAQDVLDNRPVQMIRRKGEFRIKTTKLEDFIECAEDRIDQIARPWLWQILRGKLSKEQFDEEFHGFLDAYKTLQVGESYTSSKFGFTIKKGQTKGVQVERAHPEEFTRLIAKIVCCFLHYSVRPVDLTSIEEIHNLRNHARHNDPLVPFLINWLRPLEGTTPQPFHSLTVFPEKSYCIVDTAFFGIASWRAFLHTNSPLEIPDPEGRKAEALRLILDFHSPDNRMKFTGYKFPESDSFDWYDMIG